MCNNRSQNATKMHKYTMKKKSYICQDIQKFYDIVVNKNW